VVNMDGQPGNPGGGPSYSPTVKGIEVTAKQIVDRISSVQNVPGGSDLQTADSGGPGDQASLTGIGKLLTGLEAYQEGTDDSVNSSSKDVRKQSVSKGVRQMSISSSDGHVTAEQKAVELLLEAVQVRLIVF